MNILLNEIKKIYWETKTYYPDFIVSTIISTILYFILFGLGRNDPSAAVGYFFWVLSGTVLSEASISISTEKQMGTLQNLLLKPYAIVWIMTAKTIAWFIVDVIKLAIILTILYFTVGLHITFHPLVLVVLVITMISIYGFSLVLMALTMVYTKTASFESIINYVMLFCSGAIFTLPDAVKAIADFFPFTLGIRIAIDLCYGNVAYVPLLITALVIETVIMVLIGLGLFHLILRLREHFSASY